MNTLEKVKKEIYEKYGFPSWEAFMENYEDEDLPVEGQKIHLTEAMLNDFIQFGYDFGFNRGVAVGAISNSDI